MSSPEYELPRSSFFSMSTPQEGSSVEINSESWKGRKVSCFSKLWDEICEIIQKIFGSCLACFGKSQEQSTTQNDDGGRLLEYVNGWEPQGRQNKVYRSETKVELRKESARINKQNFDVEINKNKVEKQSNKSSNSLSEDSSSLDDGLNSGMNQLPKVPVSISQELIITKIFEDILKANVNVNVNDNANLNSKIYESGIRHNLETSRQPQRSADSNLTTTVNKDEVIGETQSPNLSSLSNVEIMNLFHNQESVLRERFHHLSDEKAFQIMIRCKQLPFDILNEPQQFYCFSNLEIGQLDEEEIYGNKDHILTLYCNNEKAKERFQGLPNEEAAAFIVKFKLRPDGLLSNPQKDYLYSNLKADQVDQKLYDKLYPRSDYHTSKESKERFQKLPNEEAFNLMIKFDCNPLWLLSNPQKNYFFSHLKADQIDKNLYDKLYPQFFNVHSDKESKERFQKLPDEEAFTLMIKLDLKPLWLLSDSQKDYFFSHLKADQIDKNLYDKLYPRLYVSHVDKESKERFQKLPNKEALALMIQLDCNPLWLLSDPQENYFFSHLKSDQVDQKLYDKLYPRSDYNTSKESKERFQKLPNEEAFTLMIKLDLKPLWLLSDPQKDYFFSHLKADQIDKNLYDNLYPRLYVSHVDKESKERFQKLPNKEALALMIQLDCNPLWLLSDPQQDYFFSHLKADQIDKNLYDKLYPRLYVSHVDKESKERFQKLPNKEALALMIQLDCNPLWLLSDPQQDYFFSHLKADQVEQKHYDQLYPYDRYSSTNSGINKTSKERFQKLPNEEAAAFMVQFNRAPESLLSETQKDYCSQVK